VGAVSGAAQPDSALTRAGAPAVSTHRAATATAPAYRHAARFAARGFTLVEVLVALAIVAIALLAGVQATNALTTNAGRQSDVLLAHLCAENQLAGMRLSRSMPGIGDNDSACEQAGRVFTVRMSVRPTPNPSFRRVDAQVLEAGRPVLRIATVVGRW
jgi:general secretion pathway protein I